jgi:phage gpG-like protein
MRININTAQIARFLRRLDELNQNQEPVLRSIGTTLKSITEGAFNSVGADFRPKPWPPKRDGSASNLQASGTLAKSFTLDVSSNSVTLGNPTIYAAIHQFGGTIKPKDKPLLRFQSGGRWWSVKQVTIPARPFVPLDDSGRLTKDAADLMLRAGIRALQRLLSEPEPGASPLA